jgi:hypothetical protein
MPSVEFQVQMYWVEYVMEMVQFKRKAYNVRKNEMETGICCKEVRTAGLFQPKKDFSWEKKNGVFLIRIRCVLIMWHKKWARNGWGKTRGEHTLLFLLAGAAARISGRTLVRLMGRKDSGLRSMVSESDLSAGRGRRPGMGRQLSTRACSLEPGAVLAVCRLVCDVEACFCFHNMIISESDDPPAPKFKIHKTRRGRGDVPWAMCASDLDQPPDQPWCKRPRASWWGQELAPQISSFPFHAS